ncbi:MAG: succinate dehydrogenase, cytochrome b556 subunit [Zoogloeaceae bacterium]|jgi:succinate dehydrogenase / fumarate reductase cytochrome b subunit|nr:succinate dehydrogenase, cytochrome b556 subunit [Zoogloeaceae bacterium]
MAEMILKQRPRNIGLGDISRYRLPLPGKVSILHRVSGVGLFLFLGPLLWLFQTSLTSPECFERVVASPFTKLVLTGLIWAFLHHFCAGIRFLLLDAHIGTDIQAARQSALAVLAASLVLTVILGGALWL